MGHGASVAWVLGIVLIGASSVLSCGGRSEEIGGDEGSPDDGFGGSSGNATGGTPTGGTGAGGSAPLGGAGQGGTIVIGGSPGVGGTSTGTGGARSCSECYDAEYGIVIKGDGPTYEMSYNGWLDASTSADRISVPCPESPVRGTVAGCVRSISFSACEDPMSGPPCLEVTGAFARYVSRQTGELFTGRVTSDVPATSIPGVESGTLGIELANAAGETLVLAVSYTFCSPLVNLRIPC